MWRTSVIEVITVFKIHVQKYKVCKKTNRAWGVDRNIRPSESQSGITRQGSDARQWLSGRIYPSHPW